MLLEDSFRKNAVQILGCAVISQGLEPDKFLLILPLNRWAHDLLARISCLLKEAHQFLKIPSAIQGSRVEYDTIADVRPARMGCYNFPEKALNFNENLH